MRSPSTTKSRGPGGQVRAALGVKLAGFASDLADQSSLVAKGLPIAVDNSPTHHLSPIGNDKRPSMKVSVAVGGSLNRISHHARAFFAGPPSVVRDSG